MLDTTPFASEDIRVDQFQLSMTIKASTVVGSMGAVTDDADSEPLAVEAETLVIHVRG